MPDIFWSKKAVVFVRGANGVANAGGCSRAWWDNEIGDGTVAEVAAALAKLMGDDGAPIVDTDSLTFTNATSRIDAASPGDFVDVEAGMVVYASGTNLTAGMYEVATADPDYIILGPHNGAGDNTDTVLVIGGAFDSLQNASDETTAADYSCWIYTSKAETLAAAIDIDAGGGDATANTFKRIIGFNATPGDMDRGGAFYESAFDMLLAGSIDADKCVLLDADGGEYSVLDIDQDNVIIENLHCYNNAGTSKAVTFTLTPQNIVFRNCRWSSVFEVCATDALYVLFDSCFTSAVAAHNYVVSGGHHTFLGCVSVLNANVNFVNVISVTADFVGCVVAGAGKYGVHTVGAGAYANVFGNTFYGLTSYGVYQNAGDSVVVVGNIFCLAPGAVGIRLGTNGSVAYNDYNCFIETDGTPLVPVSAAAGAAPVAGDHSVAADPLFDNAGGNDFGLRSSSPLLNVGYAGLSMGAIQDRQGGTVGARLTGGRRSTNG